VKRARGVEVERLDDIVLEAAARLTFQEAFLDVVLAIILGEIAAAPAGNGPDLQRIADIALLFQAIFAAKRDRDVAGRQAPRQHALDLTCEHALLHDKGRLIRNPMIVTAWRDVVYRRPARPTFAAHDVQRDAGAGDNPPRPRSPQRQEQRRV